ncbi:MAG: hypothetical protein U0871_17080 [Gemmataceae bacterium]
MRRLLAAGALAVVGLLGTTGTAAAQGLSYQPIDTNKLVVQPTDTATNIFSGTTKYISRVVAGTIENNAVVRTINTLLGRTPDPKQTTQPGASPLPLPGSYPSTGYKNSFTPQMPTYQTFGRSLGG